MSFLNLDSLKIASRLSAGFGTLVILTLIMGSIAIFSIIQLSDLMAKIADYPFQVVDHAQRIKGNILEIDRDLGDILYKETTELNNVAKISNILDLDNRITEHLGVLQQFWLGSPEDISRFVTTLDNLKARREQALGMYRAGHQAEAVAIMRPAGESPATQAVIAVQKLLDPARHRAIMFRSQFDTQRDQAIFYLIVAMIGLMALGLLAARIVSLSITRPLDLLQRRMSGLATGDLAIEIPFRDGTTEIATIARATQAFKDAAVRLESQRWIKASIAELNRFMQSAATVPDFAQTLIDSITPLCRAGVGIFYYANDDEQRMELLASYGLKKRRGLNTEFKPGEGLVGQAVLERKAILLTEVPDDYARITTGIGEATPRQILVAPVVSKKRVLAVLEIGTFLPFTAQEEALIEEMLPAIALNLEIIERNNRTQELLVKTQQQAEVLCASQEQLRTQSEKLHTTNEELQRNSKALQEQTEQLQASEEELRAQSEQLQATNAELQHKSHVLQEQTEELRASEEELRVQSEEIQAANAELVEKSRGLELQAELLERARRESDQRALERDTANRYKSEFLSNMSHELRTPLNSMLILARSLRDNDEQNLNKDQIESAGIIYDSGTALLRLINDILDLSKVEAGKMEVIATDIIFEELATALRKRFLPMAQIKGLELSITVEPGLPTALHSDAGKIDQILNNLIGNAIKFTEHGSVYVIIKPTTIPNADLSPIQVVLIEVRDSGIGIPADKIDTVFNAFEQVDGTTSRRYGGTGLGLTISRRLAKLLGGDISITSVEDQGSTFTLTLPLISGSTQASTAMRPSPPPKPALAAKLVNPTALLASIPPIPSKTGVEDDRLSLTTGDETILVIEDDASFARIVRDLARRRGFKCLISEDGISGLQMARFYRPTGIVLDIGLPGADGWNVMEQLKQLPATRHIPVHFISAADFSKRGLEMGAVGFLTKPVTKEQIEGVFERIRHFGGTGSRRLLLIEDDASSRKAIATTLVGVEVEIISESTGEGALERLHRGEQFDCMILDLGLPGIGGLALLEQCTKEHLMLPPVVVYSGRDISDQESLALKEYTDSVVIKGVCSPDRLVDEVTLFLHSVQSRLPAEQQRPLKITPEVVLDKVLTGRTILVVDDDMRNAFALSKVLRAKGLKVLMAQDGEKAIKQIEERPEVEIVLMDIMMPGMDGYAAIREIRSRERFQNLPIIALTAKAMRGDREKCIDAGASDYLSKPIDIDALMNIIHIQLHVE